MSHFRSMWQTKLNRQAGKGPLMMSSMYHITSIMFNVTFPMCMQLVCCTCSYSSQLCFLCVLNLKFLKAYLWKPITPCDKSTSSSSTTSQLLKVEGDFYFSTFYFIYIIMEKKPLSNKTSSSKSFFYMFCKHLTPKLRFNFWKATSSFWIWLAVQ